MQPENEFTIVTLSNPVYVLPEVLNLQCYWRLAQQNNFFFNYLYFQYNDGFNTYINIGDQNIFATPGVWEYRLEENLGVSYSLALYKGLTYVSSFTLTQDVLDDLGSTRVVEWFFRWNVNQELFFMARTDTGAVIEVGRYFQDSSPVVPECEPEPPNPYFFSLAFLLCALSYFYLTPQEYVEKLVKLRDHFIIVKAYLQKMQCCHRCCYDNLTEEIQTATVISEINTVSALIEVLIMSLIADYGADTPSSAVINGFQRLFDYFLNSQEFVLLDENNNTVTSLDNCTIISYGIRNYICPGLLINRFIVSV